MTGRSFLVLESQGSFALAVLLTFWAILWLLEVWANFQNLFDSPPHIMFSERCAMMKGATCDHVRLHNSLRRCTEPNQKSWSRLHLFWLSIICWSHLVHRALNKLFQSLLMVPPIVRLIPIVPMYTWMSCLTDLESIQLDDIHIKLNICTICTIKMIMRAVLSARTGTRCYDTRTIDKQNQHSFILSGHGSDPSHREMGRQTVSSITNPPPATPTTAHNHAALISSAK